MFTLGISCMTVSNLPRFMDLTFQVPMQYCSLQHRILLTTRNIHCWVSFPLWRSCFILSGAISNCPLLFPSSILDTFQPERLIFWCHIFLPFYTIHGVLKALKLKWFDSPSPVDHILSELSTMTHPSWVALHGVAHNLIVRTLHHDPSVALQSLYLLIYRKLLNPFMMTSAPHD